MPQDKIWENISYQIRSSDWLKRDGTDFLMLSRCKNEYEIFEKIYLNVSGRIGKNWKDLYNAKRFINRQLFANQCIALILIHSSLNKYFDYTDDDVYELLGKKLSETLQDCYYYMSKN